MALLEIQDISKRFPGVQALTDVSMTVETGEVHALVGQNGAGKSTLVKCVSGVQPPDGGQIVFGGEVIRSYSPKHAYDLGIAVVYQRMQLIPWLSVSENILMGQLPTKLGSVFSRGDANRIARDLLQRSNLEIDPQVLVADLTAAERQQIVIAKALFRRAKLLILDEPTAALDAQQIDRLFELIEDLKKQGVAVMYISHHLEEIFRLADRITVLRDSKVVTTQKASELDQTEVVTLMAGRRIEVGDEVSAQDQPSNISGRTPVLEMQDVVAGALQQITFSAYAGEILGITGVIGAGGHDIARLLFGLSKPQTGAIKLQGKPYTPRGPHSAIRNHLFLVPEDPSGEGLVLPLSVAANITLVDLPAISHAGVLSLGGEKRVARQFVKSLAIRTSSVATQVRNLSGGNQQKVLLAKALQAKARLLILEEPTQGVDVHAKAEIHRIIRELGSEGKAVLVISTDIRDLLEFVDRMIVLRAGRIVDDVPARKTSYAQVLDLTVGAAGAKAS